MAVSSAAHRVLIPTLELAPARLLPLPATIDLGPFLPRPGKIWIERTPTELKLPGHHLQAYTLKVDGIASGTLSIGEDASAPLPPLKLLQLTLPPTSLARGLGASTAAFQMIDHLRGQQHGLSLVTANPRILHTCCRLFGERAAFRVDGRVVAFGSRRQECWQGTIRSIIELADGLNVFASPAQSMSWPALLSSPHWFDLQAGCHCGRMFLRARVNEHGHVIFDPTQLALKLEGRTRKAVAIEIEPQPPEIPLALARLCR